MIKENFSDDDIIDSFESDLELIQVSHWRTKLEDLINQIKLEIKPKPLPSFASYE